MSQHHTRVKHNSMTYRMRPIIAASLPAPCVQPHCTRGGVVYPDDLWDVAHLQDIALGGDPSDVGPAHRRCNRSDGGKAGRAKQLGTTPTTQPTRGFPKW